MISFATRRWFGVIFLVLLSAELFVAYRALAPTVSRLSYLSGWLLFLLMLILASYNARKKLPFLPLGSSESWLQFHVYAGWFTIALFAVHISFRVPTGWFEGTLAWLYILVTGSGIAGLFVSRVLPKRLTTRGGEVPFERIPAVRCALREQVEALALQSIPQTHSTILADFYARELKRFFERPRNFWLHLLEVRSPVNALLNKISDLNRYLNDQERETSAKIADLVRQKDGLDYHHALQLTLKTWLFTHIPLTYCLLLFSVVHVVLVFAFSGGAR